LSSEVQKKSAVRAQTLVLFTKLSRAGFHLLSALFLLGIFFKGICAERLRLRTKNFVQKLLAV
jgi:hypothetical protein